MAELSDLTGKTCLITGATQGIGREAAIALARLNADLVLVARDRTRGEAAVADVLAAGGNGQAELLIADLSSQASIRALAQAFRARHPRLHILINNAGGIFTQRRETVDGLEQTFAVNHLAYFLLTDLLLDLLKSSAPARVINVSSEAHKMGRGELDDLQGARKWGAWKAYGQSKLYNLLFTYELARRLAGTGVTANALHPGLVASGFGRNNPGLLNLVFRLGAPFMIGPEKGSRTIVYLAASPEVEGVTGQYFVKRRAARSSTVSYDEAAARRLWELSEQLVLPRPLAAPRSASARVEAPH